MITPKSPRFKLCLFSILFLMAPPAADATDWPTYRHDNARTGSTSESVVRPGGLVEHWVYESFYAPRPAWSGPAERPREGFRQRPRVIFDDALQVAVAAETVYFGSSVDNKVYALDAATGEERWSFFTDGPIRLAPHPRSRSTGRVR